MLATGISPPSRGFYLRPLDGIRYFSARNRFLVPDFVAGLVCDQDDAYAVAFTLDFGGFYRSAAHDAGTAGTSMGFGHAIHKG